MKTSVSRIRRELQRQSLELWFRMPAHSRTASTAGDVVVSLTTFPARVSSTVLTINSLLRQSTQPKVILITLSARQFESVPKELQSFQSKGVKFNMVEGDQRSYKKLLPALAEYPDDVIVTADDDVLYPRRWLESLLLAHTDTPTHILGHRGTRILGHDRSIREYTDWPPATPKDPASRIFLTGMGGILYPPRSLHGSVLNYDLAERLCPTADDIWFKAMALLAGTPTRRITFYRSDFHTIRSAQKWSLRTQNVEHNRNNEQFASVIEYFDLWDQLGL